MRSITRSPSKQVISSILWLVSMPVGHWKRRAAIDNLVNDHLFIAGFGLNTNLVKPTSKSTLLRSLSSCSSLVFTVAEGIFHGRHDIGHSND